LLYQISFMEVGVKVPEGVEYPARPVDTGQSYRSSPSKKTVIFWLVLSMLMRTVDATGFVAFDAAWVADPPDFSPHTFASSFHVMPAVLHSLLVRGWLKVFASDLGMVSASCDADSHTWALSFHDMPALSQSDLVKGWPETSAFGAASNAKWDSASPVFAIHTRIQFLGPSIKDPFAAFPDAEHLVREEGRRVRKFDEKGRRPKLTWGR
jgi:hypothetical protein